MNWRRPRRDQESGFNPRLYAERYASLANRYGMGPTVFLLFGYPKGLLLSFWHPGSSQRALWETWYGQLGDATLVQSWWERLEGLAHNPERS